MKKVVSILFLLIAGCGRVSGEGASAAGTTEPAKTTEAAAAEFDAAAKGMRAELGGTFIVERVGHYVVAGQFTRERFEQIKKHTISECSAALEKDFFKTPPTKPIKVYLFPDNASYEKWVKKLAGFEPTSPYGFFLPGSNAMMMNIGTGGGTLVHEMTHSLTKADFPECPVWLFEGLGCLFEQSHVTADGRIEGLVNWRLPGLKQGGFIGPRTLIEMPEEEFRGAKQGINYANARYLCLYLQQKKLLTKLYAEMRDARKQAAPPKDWDIFVKVIGQKPEDFEKEWHVWVNKLKWP